MTVDRKPVIGEVKSLVRALLGLELRKPDFATHRDSLEEVRKRLAQINECTFNCTLGYVIHPGKFLALDGVELLFQLHCRGFPTIFMLVFPLSQSPIEHKTP